MRKTVLLQILTAASFAGMIALPSHAQTDKVGAECDRLISALKGRAPTDSHNALQNMQVYRQGGQYQSCIEAGRAEQGAALRHTSLKPEHAAGMDVFNERGQQVGNVDRLARGSDHKVYVLMTYRGPRWPGNKQVAVPVEKMLMQDGKLLLPGVGEKEILAMPAVPEDGSTYKSLTSAESIDLPQSPGSPTRTGSVNQ